MLKLSDLEQSEEFRDLTAREKMFVATYISNGYNETHAVRTAYACKSDSVAKIMSYRLLAHPRIIMALARHREELPRETLLRLLRTAVVGKGMTREQLSALRLYAEVNGWIKAPKERPPKPQEQTSASQTPAESEYDLSEYENHS